jgi:hypothetical protein
MERGDDRGELNALEPGLRRRPRPWRLWAVITGIVGLVAAGGVAAGLSLTGAAAPSRPVTEPLKAQPPANVVPVVSRLLPASWQQPKPGWLYVLDPNQLGSESEILLVDPSAGAVMGVLRTGNDPQMALSRDGARLYVVSIVGNSDTLAVIDTATGRTQQTVAITHRKTDLFLPAWPTVALSGDGRYLLIRTQITNGPGDQRFGMSAFDTQNQALTATSVDLPGCALSQFVSTPAGEADILCGKAADDLRLVAGVGRGSAASVARVALPAQSDDRRDQNGNPRYLGELSGAVSFGPASIVSLTQNGKIQLFERSAGKVVRTVDVGLGSDQWLPPKVPVASPDGATIFVPVGTLAGQSEQRATGILAIDTATWKGRTFAVSRPFWSLTLARDGSQLYAFDPDGHALVVLDPRTGREIKAINGLGSSPVTAIVVP